MDKEAQAQCFTTQLIKRDGTFNEHGFDDFISQVNLGECGLSYAIVAVIGPQSSGKSTLLNHLFQTNFREMDASKLRGQTTEGIWIARCPGIQPCTIVMDVEGTDGRERGEDSTLFEKQSALFAIAVADITLINIWCHDIGRVNAANTPLLKIVFQVLLQLGRSRGKTTLMFVIRDKLERNFEIVVQTLWTDIETVWTSVPKAEAHKHTSLSDIFNVEIVGLSSFEENEEEFKKQVADMRQKFFQSIEPDGLAGDRQGVVPASGLSISTQAIWKVIKENKYLDMPSLRVMTANVRCQEISKDIYSSFASNQDWVELSEAVKSHLVPAGFGEKLSSLLCNCWSKYAEQVKYYDEKARTARLERLKNKLTKLVQPTFDLMLEHIQSKTLEKFKGELNDSLKEGKVFAVAARDCTEKSMRLFDEQCTDATSKEANLDSTKIRDNLSHDLDSHITEVRAAKLKELTTLHKSKFKEALNSKVKAHLEQGSDDTWPLVRELLLRETETVIYEFSSALSSFEIGEVEKEHVISKLKNYGRRLVEKKAREEAEKVFYLMKERFEVIFCHGDDSKPRNWTVKEDIPALAETAQSSSLKLLCVLAAIRLDGDTDTIWNTLKKGINTSSHLLDSSSWEEVPATMTLITPGECKSLWERFKGETKSIITQATAAQVMTANVRCEEIASDIYSDFASNQDWVELTEAVNSHLVPAGFGEKLSSLLCNCLSKYEEQVKCYDEKVGSARREQLKEKLAQLVQPTNKLMLEHIRSKTLEKFKGELNDSLNGGKGFEVAARDCTEKSMRLFDKQCEDAISKEANLDSTKIRDKFSHDMDSHIKEVRATKLKELTTLHKSKFKEALCSKVKAHLEEGSDDSWPRVRTLLHRETETVIYEFSSALSRFEMDKQGKEDMISKLKNYGRQLVEEKAREEAEKVIYLMKERFEATFCHGDNSKPRNLTDDDSDIQALAETAQYSSLKLLSVLAAIRLDGDTDTIWNTLMKGINTSSHVFYSSSWEEVPATMTLITPDECISLWGRFKEETKSIISQATAAQKGNMQIKKFEPLADKGLRHMTSRAAGIVAGGAVGYAMLAAATVATVASTHVIGGAGLATLLASPTFVSSTASKAKHYVERKLNKQWKKDDASEK